MTTFKEFYADFLKRSSESPITVHDAIVQAFDAGRALGNVITAYQLRARLVSDITTHDEETQAMCDYSIVPGDKWDARLIKKGRDIQIARYRDALAIIIETLERMEAERAAEVNR